jgi:hypothetical protein
MVKSDEDIDENCAVRLFSIDRVVEPLKQAEIEGYCDNDFTETIAPVGVERIVTKIATTRSNTPLGPIRGNVMLQQRIDSLRLKNRQGM